MPLRVCHLVTSFDMGGLQNGIVNLVNHSDPQRVEHHVLAMKDRMSLTKRLTQGASHCVGLGEGRQAAAYKSIAKCLKDIAPDILHTRNWGTYPDGILAARQIGLKRRVHGYHGRDLRNAHGEIWRRRILGKILSWGTDKIITLTPAMKREYMRDFAVPAKRIQVIPNGIDLARMSSFESCDEARSSFTVLTVGRLAPVKDIPLLMRAFAVMPGRETSDRLLIVGDGPERARIEELARELDLGASIQLLGARSDAPAVMKGADVYVQPSIYEGMSNTIVEAMACELAVVATAVGGNPDVAGTEGTAVLVPSGDVEKMAAALGELKADRELRAKIATRGRDRVVECFGLDRMVESYTAMYEQLVQS